MFLDFASYLLHCSIDFLLVCIFLRPIVSQTLVEFIKFRFTKLRSDKVLLLLSLVSDGIFAFVVV